MLSNYRTVKSLTCRCDERRKAADLPTLHIKLKCGCEFCPNNLQVSRCDESGRIHRRLSKYINLANDHNDGERAS